MAVITAISRPRDGIPSFWPVRTIVCALVICAWSRPATGATRVGVAFLVAVAFGVAFFVAVAFGVAFGLAALEAADGEGAALRSSDRSAAALSRASSSDW